MSNPDFNLEDFLPYRLSIAANRVSKQIAKTYAPYKLSRTQWRVMAVLAGAQTMTAQMVSDKTGMDKTTVSRAVKKLLDRELISRCANTEDARATSLSLCQKGGAMFDKIIPDARRQEQSVKDVFSTKELQMLTSLLDKIAPPTIDEA